MNPKVQDYLNSLRAQKRAEYDKKKSEFLISQGLWEDVRSPKDSWDEEYPYSGYDESTGKYYYFKRSALDVSDEEYEEMLSLNGENPAESNSVSNVIFAIAMIVYICGFLAGIILGALEDDFNAITMLIVWVSSFVSGSLFLGFSEIIKLLHSINNKK